jgi:hypothetical protein
MLYSQVDSPQQKPCAQGPMAGVIQSKIGISGAARIDVGAVLRYSVIFAAIVAPVRFIGLDFPAAVLAIWVIARSIARRYRRQITVRETFQLALASWTWTFVTWFLVTAVKTGSPGFLMLFLPWELVHLVFVWAGYLWLARLVIRRKLGSQLHMEEPSTAAQMLAQQEERYAEAKARAITLGVAGWLTLGSVVLLPLFVVGMIVVVLLGLMGLKVGEGTFFFVAAAIGLLVLLGWAYFVSRKSAEVFPSHRLVLWLRRFHRADLMEFPFPSFLERVCRGIAVPITLQDSTVSEAETAAELRPAFRVQQAVVALSWFAILIPIGDLLGSRQWFDLRGGSLVALAATGIAGLVTVHITMHRLGALHLGTKRGQRLIKRLLDAIDSTSGVPQTLTVVSTPDESWQSWVLEFMKRADAVLIDVTHLSKNLYWELQAIAAHLDAEQLILAYGVPEGHEEGIPKDIQAELASLLGEEMLERSHRFYYQLPRHRRWRGVRKLIHSRRGWQPSSKTSEHVYSQQLAEVLHKSFTAADARSATNGSAKSGQIFSGSQHEHPT